MDERPKQPDIYGLVNHFYDGKAGKVFYVAHAILDNGAIVQIGEVTSTPDKGNTKVPANHPDRIFWEQKAKGYKAIKALPALQNPGRSIARIEIDCSLMPCGDQYGGCVYKVPALIEGLGYPKGIRILMYSHRDQGMAGAGESSKRVLECQVGDQQQALTTAFSAVGDWSWVPWTQQY